MGTSHRRLAIVGVLAAALVLTGCPDDDGAGSTTTTSTSAAITTTTSGGPSTTAASGTTTPSSTTTTAAPAPAQVTGVAASTGGGSGETELTWPVPPIEAHIASYKLYKRRADGTNLAPITVSATTLPPLEPGRLGVVDAPDYDYWPTTEPDPGPRCYKVSAVSAAGVEGPQSAEACASPVGG